MVFTAVEQRRVQYSTLTTNDAVVAVEFWKEAIGKELEPLSSRIRFSWTDHSSFDDFLKQAAALPPHSAIFWELMIVDAAGVVHEGGTPLARLHEVANAPIFSYDESFFGRPIWKADVRLERDEAVGHQREPIAARKRNLLPRSDCVGPISIGNSGDLCSPFCAGRSDFLVDL
jgi:hypothetical protein